MIASGDNAYPGQPSGWAGSLLQNTPKSLDIDTIIRGGGSPEMPTPSWTGVLGYLLDSSEWAVPTWTGVVLKSCLAATLTLYILNQKHLLPKPLSAFVSKVLFWPSMPLTVIKRLGSWSTVIDDTVVIGAAPLGFVNFPERLYNDYGIRGVINLCEEYAGPEKHYKRLGMAHLRLPTVDHFEPTVADFERGVAFIKKHKDEGTKVYVHCKAGHGRSAALVFAWLIYNDPKADLKKMNKEFCLIRNVRKTLWTQKNILAFRSRMQSGDMELTELTNAKTKGDEDDVNSKKEL